ncbi:hypothetical protein WN774_004583 [Salmonella enterica subsp. enterica serovar Bredeney]
MFRIIAGLLVGVLSFPSSGARTDFSVNLSTAVCNANVPSEYFLGTLQDGTKEDFSPFNVTVVCGDYGTKGRVLATTPNNPLTTGGDTALVNGTSEFWLLNESGNKIDLTGRESGAPFCTFNGDITQQCKVRPAVKINPADPRGVFRINVSFSVMYL